VAAPSGKWDFSDQSTGIKLSTRGGSTGDAATFLTSYGITVDGTSPYVINCAPSVPNMLAAVYDGQTLAPIRDVPGNYDVCGLDPNLFYHFASGGGDNLNTPARQAQLLALLTSLKPGQYVALVSMNRVNFSTFSPELKAALKALGSQLIDRLQDGDPFVFLGQKGPGARPAQELTFDAGSTVARAEQVITLDAALRTRAARGTVTSTLIGPAKQWGTLLHTVRTEPSDSYTLRLIGIDKDGNQRQLNADVKNRQLALSGVSAQEYPYLQLVLQVRDTLNRTAPQLKQWLVTYEGLPEGIVRRDLAEAKEPKVYDSATLAQQAMTKGELSFPVMFQNVSSLDFAQPLIAEITVRDESGRNVRKAQIQAPSQLKAGATVTFDVRLDVRGLLGVITGEVIVNPRLQPEQFYFNNELRLPPFTIENRNTPPVLDVAFDGQHILDGDIVSPVPIIMVQLNDEDKLNAVRDANSFDLFLTKPGESIPVKVPMTGSDVVFTSDVAKGVARVEYQPGKQKPLDNGIYKLEVQGRDATNLAASAQRYSIRFEVINESTVTNFYPYPNPITSKAKFVFTLTGAELPRDLKIQVMTLTGKVVREIMMAELGPLHIGNNITDYAWDGTDEFGDQLANGTYLYRVVMDNPSQFERRRTAGDRAFKKEWGKLVLLR
jgi:hypothetical protein